MSERTSDRSRYVSRVGVAMVFGILFAFLPSPGFTFSPVAAAETTTLASTEDVAPEDLAAQQAVSDEPLSEDRVVGTVDGVEAFTTLGVTFDDDPSEPVMARVKGADGTWGEWNELELEQGGPDPGTAESRAAEQVVSDSGTGTAPFWVGEGTGYEVSVARADAGSADVVVVREETRRAVADSTPMAGSIPVAPPFTYHVRSTWGARPSTGVSAASTINLAVVHHSDSSNAYSPGDVPGILRSIQAYHMDGRGWADIGYNFVVDKYGTIWEGREGGVTRPIIGAHAAGFNTNSVGVMVLGDYTAVQPTAASLESVSQVIGWKFVLHDNNPNTSSTFTSGGSDKYAAGQVVNLPRVVGHLDTQATSCPGSIESSLGSIRNRAQEWTNYLRSTAAPYGSFVNAWSDAYYIGASGTATDPLRTPAYVRLTTSGGFADTNATNGRWQAGIGGVWPGLQDVCATILGVAVWTSLGCTTVRVPDPAGTSPDGRFLVMTPYSRGLEVIGWAADPETNAAIPLDLYVDGQWRNWAWAAAWHPSVPQPWASRGNHAYLIRQPDLAPGSHRVCMVPHNVGKGYTTWSDCAMVNIPK